MNNQKWEKNTQKTLDEQIWLTSCSLGWFLNLSENQFSDSVIP